MAAITRVLVLGAAGRDFYDFATVLRDAGGGGLDSRFIGVASTAFGYRRS